MAGTALSNRHKHSSAEADPGGPARQWSAAGWGPAVQSGLRGPLCCGGSGHGRTR